MKKYFIALVVISALAFAGIASAALEPGVFDPGNTNICRASFSGGVLHLIKDGATETNCAAGADITGQEGDTLTGLEFTITDGSHCGAGSLRFDVVFSDDTFRIFTCQYGSQTENEDGTITVRFDTFTPYCDFASAEPDDCFNEGVTISSVDILLDEQGFADVSNIRVNGDLEVPAPVVPPVVIPEVPVDTTPAQTYLCYSKFPGAVPAAVNTSDAPARLVQGWFSPYAVAGRLPAPAQNIDGNFHLACNIDGLKPTGTGLNGSEGDFLDASAWKDVLVTYGAAHLNHFEIAK